jgi:hypothetical protein
MRLNQQLAKALGFTDTRAHKYRAKRTELDGITFPSLKEAGRYAELVMLEQAGAISHLEVDAHTAIRYPLVVNGFKVCDYRPDFRYRERGQVVCEDTKGFQTPVFQLKAKLFRALYTDTELRIT